MHMACVLYGDICSFHTKRHAFKILKRFKLISTQLCFFEGHSENLRGVNIIASRIRTNFENSLEETRPMYIHVDVFIMLY